MGEKATPGGQRSAAYAKASIYAEGYDVTSRRAKEDSPESIRGRPLAACQP